MDGEDKRRKRIERMKKAILITLTLIVLVPWLICGILLVRVGALDKQVDEMLTDQQVFEELLSEQELMKDIIGTMAEDVQLLKENKSSVSNNSKGENETEVFADGVSPITSGYETKEPKKVYLTFDDGPSANTAEILDILNIYQVKATFFVVGKTDEQSQALYRRIIEEGHTLGMHSYSHVYESIYSSPEEFQKDYRMLKELLLEATGVIPVYYRFPGGSSNSVSNVDVAEFIQFLHEEGCEYIDWNVTNGDALSTIPNIEDMVQLVMNDVSYFNIPVVLMHDSANKTATVEALPIIIEQLRAMGYELAALDDEAKLVQHVKVADE